MGRPEITRSNEPRTVKTTVIWRPESARPSATNLRSSLEWSSSKLTTIGRLRNGCSHSAWDTSCLAQVFSELPLSHWKPSQLSNNSSSRLTCDVYDEHIHLSTQESRQRPMRRGY